MKFHPLVVCLGREVSRAVKSSNGRGWKTCLPALSTPWSCFTHHVHFFLWNRVNARRGETVKFRLLPHSFIRAYGSDCCPDMLVFLCLQAALGLVHRTGSVAIWSAIWLNTLLRRVSIVWHEEWACVARFSCVLAAIQPARYFALVQCGCQARLVWRANE